MRPCIPARASQSIQLEDGIANREISLFLTDLADLLNRQPPASLCGLAGKYSVQPCERDRDEIPFPSDESPLGTPRGEKKQTTIPPSPLTLPGILFPM